MSNEISTKTDAPTDVVEPIKGFDADFRANGRTFEVGKTYTIDGELNEFSDGFDAVPADEHPLTVFGRFPPASSRYAIVVQGGATIREDGWTASASISVKSNLDLSGLISSAVKWVRGRTSPANSNNSTGDRSASQATGDLSASQATGYRSASQATGDLSASQATGPLSASQATGDRSASQATGPLSASQATGYRSASQATGDLSASQATGDRSASQATGYRSASQATGYRSASQATGDLSASQATGDRSASQATGYRSASLATGWEASATVDSGNGIAIATSGDGRVRGEKAGDGLILVHRADDGGIIDIWTGIVGRDGIEPSIFYTLRDGKPVKVDADESDED